MRAAVRSVSARSVSGLRAGSALTIGVGVADAYTKAANVLRPVGGRMFIASPQYAAINTDGSGAITNGSAVGLLRDYVGGTATLTQATAGKKLVARKVPVLGPELVSNSDFSTGATGYTTANATASVVSGELVTTASAAGNNSADIAVGTLTPGVTYQLNGTYRKDVGGGAASLRLARSSFSVTYITLPNNSTTSAVQSTGTFTATSSEAGIGMIVRCFTSTSTASGDTSIFDNVSLRAITGYTQQWEWVSDGADDVLVGSAGPTLSDGLVMVWAGNNLSRVVGGRIAALANAGATSWMAIFNEATGISARVMVASTAVNTAIAATTLGANYVAAIRLTGTTLQLRVNSGAWITLAHGLTLNDVALIPAVGSQTNTANFANADHAFASFANLGANATDAKISILEEAAAKAAGVTLL